MAPDDANVESRDGILEKSHVGFSPSASASTSASALLASGPSSPAKKKKKTRKKLKGSLCFLILVFLLPP